MDATPYLASACAALVGKIIFDWLKPKNGNGRSGEKSTDYWEREIRKIMEEVMDRRNATLKELVREAVRDVFRQKGL